MLLTLSLVHGLVASAIVWKDERPAVDIPGKGRVIGVTQETNNVTFYAFRGIPFAKPPIGPLRFKDPVQAEGWSGDLDASVLPPACSQITGQYIPFEDSEDCLYISVYTPTDALDAEEPLAVLVFIHGGAWVIGSMSGSDVCSPLVEKGVIIAAMQYRLGIFGFLSTEDYVAPGNAGLKDQTLALRWIKENIAAFGGDPDKITIFGESAGSASVHEQLLTPAAKGLFRGAIMQSGTALSPAALGRDFLEVAQDVGDRFDCPQNTSEELITCLQDIPAENLTALNQAYTVWDVHPFVFAPRVDGFYFPDDPLKMVQNGNYTHVPIIVGTNKDEGALFSIDVYAFPASKKSLVDNFDVSGPASLDLLPSEDPLVTTQKIYDYYLPDLVLDEEQADNATAMFGHRNFHIPTDWTVELISNDTPVFMYELSYRGEHGYMDLFLNRGVNLPPAKKWVSHADDLQYMFDMVPLETEDDLAVREVFTSMWTNFAKTLDPTPDESLGFKWEKVELPALRHLSITPSPQMMDDYRHTDRQFWRTLPLKENPYYVNRK